MASSRTLYGAADDSRRLVRDVYSRQDAECQKQNYN